MSVFINLSNHPSEKWSEDQLRAAQAYGRIIDMPFPEIDPEADAYAVSRMVCDTLKVIEEIYKKEKVYLMCQGESTFVAIMAIEQMFKGCSNVKMLFACSRRDTQEIVQNGETKKISTFRFVRFREL